MPKNVATPSRKRQTERPRCKCGARMVRRKPGTPEQAWCGTWFECPKAQAKADGHTEGHYDSVLIPSRALEEQDRKALGRKEPARV